MKTKHNINIDSIIIPCLFTCFMLLFSVNLSAQPFVVIKKSKHELVVINELDTLFFAPIACGKNIGQKKEKGDYKTPEGHFKVKEINNSSSWKHDFKDGLGLIKNAYGPYFIRLDIPRFKGIGIHGTHDESSIGSNCTEGCIRLRNEDLCLLMNHIYIGMPVDIFP